MTNIELASVDGQAGTKYHHSFDKLENEVGTSGDGSTLQKARKIVVFVTDGVATNTMFQQGAVNASGTRDNFAADPNYVPFQTVVGNGTGVFSVGGFDPNVCSRLKNVPNAEVYTINAEYATTFASDGGVNDNRKVAIENNLKPDIVTNMEKCALGAANSFRAGNGPESREAFKQVIQRISADDLRVTG